MAYAGQKHPRPENCNWVEGGDGIWEVSSNVQPVVADTDTKLQDICYGAVRTHLLG